MDYNFQLSSIVYAYITLFQLKNVNLDDKIYFIVFCHFRLDYYVYHVPLHLRMQWPGLLMAEYA